MSIGSGTRLGPYEVQDFVGQGAMGVVYRAYHSGLERTGAVKVMQAITPDPDTVARFRHEAQAIARLRHPNIVDVYDFGEFQGTPYMIVEYVPGGSLAAKMAHGPLDRGAALRYLHGIAAGLDYAHSHGIVHRDIKPANVLLTEDDSPVLADFGLAKLVHGSSLKSMTGVTTGTPAYMAPEQVTGGQVGPAADRYSLTTIAYEMLTGVIPFDGEALMELLYAQVHRYPAAPSARDQSLGPQVDAVIMRGLAKNPAERWESCGGFVDALESALKEAPVPATPAPTMVIAPPTMPAKPVAQATARPATRLSKRRITIAVAALLVLVLVLGVCAAVAQATTLTVNPSRVTPGGTVTVTATHVPANRVGEIQLWSSVQRYAFRADANGTVSRDIAVPSDIELGNHVVKICWDGTCHKQAPLVVVSGGVGEVQQTPHPGSTSTPSSVPGSTPRPTSTPTSRPSPTPAKPSPILTVNPTTVHILASRDVTLNGFYWPPGTKVAINFIQVGRVSTQIGNQNVQAGGSFSWTGGIPSDAIPGSATIQACDGSVCKTESITVTT